MGEKARAGVYFSPASCPKAGVDREKLAWAVAARGLEVVNEVSQAATVVVLTCGFIDDAKQESIDDVLTYVDLKRRGVIKRIIVAGCLPEKYGTETAAELPEVDLFVGNTCLDQLPSLLEGLSVEGWGGVASGSNLLCTGRFEGGPAGAGGSGRPPVSERPWTRTVMICDGCNNACAYCAIPQMRGPLRSRSIGDIVDEIGLLVSQGAREIVLAGQDTASYGRDGLGAGLADLLKAAAGTGAAWLRLAYVNPEHLAPGVAEAMAAHPNICHYIDMPIQHASARVLSKMGRGSTPESLRQVIGHLRSCVPDIALRTSVIVGLPGEAEADFRVLLDFLKEISFDMVGVFRYSPQPGTPAASMGPKVPTYVAEQRLIEVVGLQEQLARMKAVARVGRDLEILVEARSGKRGRGRSQYDMAEVDRVVRLLELEAAPGEFVRARVEKYLGSYELQARCLPYRPQGGSGPAAQAAP
jgi:ribosomal protein S12 methylthiotransferase